MKRTAYLLLPLAIAVLVILSTTPAWAQKPAGNTGPKYDLTSEQKLKGTVEEVKLDTRPGEGTHLMVKSGSELILVHVAPEAFLKELEIGFNKGEQLEIVGSKLKIDGVDEVLARQIAHGDNVITLRDNKGAPVWAGWDPVKK